MPACPLRPPVFFNLLAMLLLATLLAACGAAPPKPTIVQGSVEAGADINPDRRNRASPVTVRIYELKTVAVFERADFFSVWDGEAETLGGDLLGRDEIQLVPGEQRLGRLAGRVAGRLGAGLPGSFDDDREIGEQQRPGAVGRAGLFQRCGVTDAERGVCPPELSRLVHLFRPRKARTVRPPSDVSTR